MTPQFAQQMDPIFMRALELIHSIDAGEDPSAPQAQRILNDQFESAQRALAPTDGKTWELAKFALTSWIDETVTSFHNWKDRDWWMSHSLAWTHFHNAEFHTEFFIRSKEAAESPGLNDALETYYVCVMLGFRGLYADTNDSEGIRVATTRYGLPPDLAQWSGWIANVIRERRRAKALANQVEPRERTIVPARPRWGGSRLLWPWLCAVLLAGICYVLYRMTN